MKAAGEWNKMRISVNEGIVEVHVNEAAENRYERGQGGHIGLQSEGKESV